MGRAGRLRFRVLVVAALAAALFQSAVLVEWLRQIGWLVEKWGWTYWVRVALLGLALIATAATVWAGLRRWRTEDATLGWASYRGTAVCLACAYAAYFATNERFRLIEWGTATALGCGLAAAAHGFAPRLFARSPRLARGADLVGFSLVAAAALGEVGLRTWAYVDPSPLLAQGLVSYDAWVANQRCAPGSLHHGFPCDSAGNYDTDVPSEPRRDPLVVCIGDSFSLSAVPHHFHYTTVAERELGRGELYNVGIAGAGPPHYLFMLRTQALPLDPDLVVVALFLGNDVDAPGQPLPRPASLEFWFDRRRLMLWNVPVRLARLGAARRWGAAGGPATGDQPGRRSREGEPWETPAEMLANMPALADPLLEEPHNGPPEVFLRIERDRALAACHPAEADYRGILETLGLLVAASGDTPIAFMLIPDEFQVNDELWEQVAADRPELDRFKPQQTVGAWLAERGIPCLDLLPVLRTQEPLEDGRLHLYHLRDTHFNARGNAVAGAALASFVAELLGLR